MADLSDLLKKASAKTTMSIVKAPKRDFGLKKTMESIKNEGNDSKLDKVGHTLDAKLSSPILIKEIIKSETVDIRENDFNLNKQNATMVDKTFGDYIAIDKIKVSNEFPGLDALELENPNKMETNQRQTEDILETNPRQTRDNIAQTTHLQAREISKYDKPEINQRQTGDNKDKPETNRRQTRDCQLELETTKPITKDKLHPKLETLQETNQRQTGNKLQTTNPFSSLVGLQRTLVIEIYKSCKSTRTTLSEPFSVEYLTELTQSTASSIKKTIQRLEQKEIIRRVEFKNGRGGWTIYTINDYVHQSLLRQEAEGRLETKWGQSGDKLKMQLRTELETSLSSKLVSNINNNLLTKDSNEVIEPALEVTGIVLVELNKYGITRKQIQDISNQKLKFTTSTLQDFVDRFAIYASDSKNIRNVNNIPAIFVKMAQLASKGQDPLVDIETDTDRLIRERIESLKAKQEDRQRQESELATLEFENWYTCLSQEQMDQAAPPTPASKSGSFMQKIILKNYFIESVWPVKRASLYGTGLKAKNETTDELQL